MDVQTVIECLAKRYGFDIKEANEVVKMSTQKPAEPAEEEDTKLSPLEKTRKNVTLWTKKLEANKFKDDDAKAKHIEKLEKEKKKLEKLEAAAPKPVKKVEDAPVKKIEEFVKKAEDPKQTSGDGEKRIKRMSPTLAGQLRTALETVGLEYNEKIKKEFVKYVDDLTEDDFLRCDIPNHMRAFAKLRAPPVVMEGRSNAAGGGPDDVSTPLVLPVDELRKIDMLATIEPTGVFWDGTHGRAVTGPPGEPDEDVIEITFESKEYVIGEKSKRVYEVSDKGDKFAGFVGVGRFKAMNV